MKRFISMLLVLCMVMSMVPAYASAEEQDQQATVDTDDVTLEGTNSIGTMLVEEIQEDQAEQEDEISGGYVILGVTVEGSTATVSFDTMETAQLMVGLYSEDGVQLIASGKTLVTKDAHEATVTIEGTVPQYFMVRVFLLDNYDLSPLCKAYTTPIYTQEMQNLLASTAENYDQDRVLTLGEDTSTNFVVYEESTLLIPYQEGVNVLESADEESQTYVFSNVDDYITGLAVDDILSYTYNGSDVLIVKVKSIVINGTTATVIGTDVELEEVFSYMKLEQIGDAGELEQDESQSADKGVTFEGVEEEASVPTRDSGEVSFTKTAKFNVKQDIYNKDDIKVTLNGKFDLQLDVNLSFYITWSHRFVEFTVQTVVETSVSVTAELDHDISLGVYTIDLCGVQVGIAPVVTIQISATLSLDTTFIAIVGFSYDSNAGAQDLSSFRTVKEPEWKLEGSIYIALDICPTIRILGGWVAEINLHVPVGLELRARRYLNPNYSDITDYGHMIHHCEDCLETALYCKFVPSLEIQFLKCKYLKHEETFRITRKKIVDMYYSSTLDQFDLGMCPNKSYRLTVAAEDHADQPVAGAPVAVYKAADNTQVVNDVTNSKGVYSTYLKPDIYIFEMKLDGQSYGYEQEFTEAGKVVLGPNVAPGKNFFAEKVDPMSLMDHGDVIAEDTDTNGVTWALYESGYMWLDSEGDAAMTDYSSYSSLPWYKHRSKITHIIVSDRVLGIGNYAFYGCSNLQSVELGENVETIGEYAFYSCTGLTNVSMMDNVQEIGERAFQSCTKLTDVMWSENLRIIGTNAFRECKALTAVELGDYVTNIESYAFYNCQTLKEITIPESVTTLGGAAFGNTYSMEKIYYNAVNVTSWTSSAGEFIKTGCSSGGVDVVIGPEVTQIPAYLFYLGNYQSTSNAVNIKSVTFAPGSKCTMIDVAAFKECDSLTEITLPEGLTTISMSAFWGCDKLETVNLPSTLTTIDESAFYQCVALKEILLPDAVTTLGRNAFFQCTSLQKATLGSGLVEIDSNAFKSCTSLKDVVFAEGLESIGSEAFLSCSALEELTFPGTLLTIDSSAFRDSTSLKVVNINEQLTTVGSYAFAGCPALEQIRIPDSVTTLGNYLFDGDSSLTSLYIGSGVKTVTYQTFGDCINLVQLEMSPANKTYFSKNNCIIKTSTKELVLGCSGSVIPDDGSVTSIGQRAFSQENTIKQLYIPATITTIGNYAFSGSDALEQVVMADGVTSIGNYAFQLCTSLKSVTLSNRLKTLGSNAFYGCSALAEIRIPDLVTKVPSYAFKECTALTKVVLGSSVTSVESYAFSGCAALTTVSLNEGLTSLGTEAFIRCTALPSISLPNSLTSIGSSCFAGCTALTDITIGSGLTSIASYAFQNCDALQEITIPGTVQSLGTYCFAACDKLEKLVISDGVQQLQSYAFQDCVKLNDVYLSNTLQSIGSYAFNYCSALTSIHIPDSVTAINSYAFARCTELTNVTIGTGLTSLGSNAFYNDSKLTSITFTGNAPSFNSSALSYLTTTVNYPADNDTWTSVVDESYGGKAVTWTSYEPATKSVRSVMTVQSQEEEVIPEETAAEVTEPVAETVVQTQPVTETVTEAAVESVTEPETEAVVEGSSKPATRAVYPGNQESQATDTNTIRTATFENLVPGQEYVMLALVSMEVEDLLAADNVLYIYQAAADENGVLQVAYIQRVTTGLTYIMACGASYDDISAAQVEFPMMGADEELQAVDPVVTYEGQVLTEGEDYTIVGTVDYTAAGEYTCYIRGIYDYTGMITCTYTVRGDISTEHTDEWDCVTLCSDTQLELVLTNDLYLDLAGCDLTGTIITGEHNLYIMDSTTNEYSAANVGYLNCVDENGDPFVPQTTYAIDGAVAGENMRYLTLKTEDGYSFHRYMLEVTHMSLKPAHTAVGYKAQFCGDEMILAALDQTNALGFNMSLEGACEISRYMSTDRITSGKSISLRIQNYDVEGYGQAKLSVKARLQLADGTVVDSEAYAYSLQEMVEMVNEYYADYAADKLAALADMIEQYPIMQTWNVENILAA